MLDWINKRIEEIRYPYYWFADNELVQGIPTIKYLMPNIQKDNALKQFTDGKFKITSDIKGEDVLFVWRVEDKEWFCGCKYHYSGWYDVKAGYMRSPIDSIIYEVGKQDDHFHGVMHQSGGQLASGYVPGHFPYGSRFYPASALPPKEDNGDPLL